MSVTVYDLFRVLKDELVALEVWINDPAIPQDVKEGIEISMSKIETVLREAGEL